MDAVVESVLTKHEIVIAAEVFERDFAEALACDADMPDKVNRAICNLLNIRRWADGNANENAYNIAQQGLGLHGIGDQHAHGSPMNLLGAAYHNAFGT